MISLMEISFWLEAEKISSSCFGGPRYSSYYKVEDEPYEVTFERDSDGTELKVKGTGKSIEQAYQTAYAKWTAIVNNGIPQFRGPLLEHKEEI